MLTPESDMAAMVIRPVFLHGCLEVAYARMKEGGFKANLYIKGGLQKPDTLLSCPKSHTALHRRPRPESKRMQEPMHSRKKQRKKQRSYEKTTEKHWAFKKNALPLRLN